MCLTEAVVVVGYGVQKKINLTGAVTSVKSEDLLKTNSANSTNALIGQMPGLIAKQPTGEPGNDNSNLYIRGIATWTRVVCGKTSDMKGIICRATWMPKLQKPPGWPWISPAR
ncbi:MAG: TonB-dependent receptor plug domain-containing protein [Tannerellaceae bacterium]|nr:TonB-dependent receptor plug domain-containing protein [Tannerellaceae bacterium]